MRKAKNGIKAKDLQVGDKVRNAEGETGEVEEVTTEQTSQEMYNLTVDEAHTFYVGEGQWLVHNCNWLGAGDAPAWGKELAETADNIYVKLSKDVKSTSTLGFTQIGDQSLVTITGKPSFHQQALDELESLVRGADIIFIPNPDRVHAERLLYEQYGNVTNFRGIGISHVHGPCYESCKLFLKV